MKKRRVIDTNLLIRLLTKDDPEQYQKVYALFQQEDIFLIETVLLETELVLRYSYQFEKHQIIQKPFTQVHNPSERRGQVSETHPLPNQNPIGRVF